MTVNNQASLRIQLIAAMEHRFGKQLAESVFQCDIWPVLEAAMKAGELLVHRNTGPVQKPVSDALTSWLEVVHWTVSKIKAVEPTVSKRELLKFVYDLDDQCTIALGEARMVADMLSPPKLPKI